MLGVGLFCCLICSGLNWWLRLLLNCDIGVLLMLACLFTTLFPCCVGSFDCFLLLLFCVLYFAL